MADTPPTHVALQPCSEAVARRTLARLSNCCAATLVSNAPAGVWPAHALVRATAPLSALLRVQSPTAYALNAHSAHLRATVRRCALQLAATRALSAALVRRALLGAIGR